jgi:hypothetical protein
MKLTSLQIPSSHMFPELCCWMMKLLTPRFDFTALNMAKEKTAISSSPHSPVTIQMIP